MPVHTPTPWGQVRKVGLHLPLLSLLARLCPISCMPSFSMLVLSPYESMFSILVLLSLVSTFSVLLLSTATSFKHRLCKPFPSSPVLCSRVRCPTALDNAPWCPLLSPLTLLVQDVLAPACKFHSGRCSSPPHTHASLCPPVMPAYLCLCSSLLLDSPLPPCTSFMPKLPPKVTTSSLSCHLPHSRTSPLRMPTPLPRSSLCFHPLVLRDDNTLAGPTDVVTVDISTLIPALQYVGLR